MTKRLLLAAALAASASAQQLPVVTRTNSVSWNPVSGAASYTLAVSAHTSPVPTNGFNLQASAVLGQSTAPASAGTNRAVTAFVPASLADGTYSVWAKTEDSNGLSSAWSTNMVILLETPPLPPGGLKVQ